MTALSLIVSLLPATSEAPTPPTAPKLLDPAPLFVQDEAEAPPAWTGSISLGVTFARGNTEQTTVAGSFDAERATDEDRWTTNAWFNLNDQVNPDTGAEETTAKNFGGKVQYDRFVSEHLYWLANLKGERDEIAALQLRATGGGGVGYQFYDTEKFDLNGEIGLNYVHEDLEGQGAEEWLAGRLAYNADYIWTETTRFAQAMEFFPSFDDSDDWTGKLDSAMDVSMSEAMFLRVQHVLLYDNTPASGQKPADNRLILTIGWTF